MADTYKPTASMAANARRALDAREDKPESEKGMTSVGLARARQLINREPLSLDTVKRMYSFLSRHEVDKKGETWDEQGKGYQAYNGWGGDSAKSWAKRILDSVDKLKE